MTVLPQLQAELTHADRRWLRRRSRQRRAGRGAIALAVVAAIATPALTIDLNGRDGQTGLLRVAAARAAERPAHPVVGFKVTGVTAITSDDRPYIVRAPYVKTVRLLGGGAYEERSRRTGPLRFAVPEDKHRGKLKRALAAHILPAPLGRVEPGSYVGPNGRPRTIPTVGMLRAELRRLARRSVWSGHTRTGPGHSRTPDGRWSFDLVMPYVTSLLAGPTVPAEVRAAVFHSLESTEGVRVAPQARDQDGRAGVGIVRDFDHGQGLITRTTIVYDAATTRVLGTYRRVLVFHRPGGLKPGARPGDLIASATYHYDAG